LIVGVAAAALGASSRKSASARAAAAVERLTVTALPTGLDPSSAPVQAAARDCYR
jgi:hypothetical protein